MKNSMEIVKYLLVSLMLTVGGVAQAGTEKGTCVIRLTAMCNIALKSYRPNVSFNDVAGQGSHVDAGRCLQRAAEYKNWCNAPRVNPNLEVVAIYTVEGIGLIGSVTASDGLTYILHGAPYNYSYAGFSN